MHAESGLQQGVRLGEGAGDVGVVVHPEDFRAFVVRELPDELDVRLERSIRRGVVLARAGEAVAVVENVRAVEIRQGVHEAAAILVVGDTPAVVALASQVGEGGEGDGVSFAKLSQEDGELLLADAQVRPGEDVLVVPSQGPKSLALGAGRVEEAEAEEELLELRLPLGLHGVHVVLVHRGVRVQQIRSQALRRFVRHLHAVLQDEGWEVRTGLGREPQSEVGIDELGAQLFADLLQRGKPRHAEMAVLQDHPIALTDGLHLPCHVQLFRQLVQLRHRVCARREHEDERSDAVGVFVAGVEIERRDLDELRTPRLRHELLDTRHDRVGSNRSQDAEALEEAVGLLHPAADERFWLTGLGHSFPPAEALVKVFLKTSASEGLKVGERQQVVPGRVVQPSRCLGLRPPHLQGGGALEEEAEERAVQQPLALEDLGRQQEAEQQLVLGEERAADILVQHVGEGLVEVLDSLVVVLALGRLADGEEEEANEPLQRVLVHRVHDVQVRDTEEQLRRTKRDGNVALAHARNLLLRLRRFLDLLLDDVGGDLGVLERVDEHLVIQDVALCVLEQRQDLILQLLERLLVVGAVLGGHEVEQVDLDAELRRIVRVAEVGGDVQLEVGVVLDAVVAQADHGDAAGDHDLLKQQRLQDGIQRLRHVFDEHRVAELQGVLQGAHEAAGALLDHPQRIALLHIFDPAIRLPLRVDHERPARALLQHDSVVDAERVVGKLADDPLANLHSLPEDVLQAKVFRTGDAPLQKQLAPLRHGLAAITGHEGAEVGNNAGREHDVAGDVVVLLLQRQAQVGPARLLATQAVDELLGAPELHLAVRDLFLKTLLLVLGLVELHAQKLQLVHDLLQRGLLLRQRLGRLLEVALRGGQRVALGLDVLGDFVVDHHGVHPLAQAGRGHGALLHNVRLELRVGHEVLHLGDDRRRDVVLVVVHEVLQEARVGQQVLLGRLPVVVHLLGPAVGVLDLHGLHAHHDAHGRHGDPHGARRLGHALHLHDLVLLQAAQRGQGGLQRRQRSGEVRLAAGFQGVGLRGLLIADFFLRLHHGFDLVGRFGVRRDLYQQGVGLHLRLLELGLQIPEVGLHVVHLLRRLLQLEQPVVVALLQLPHASALDVKQVLEGVDEAQVRRGRDVVVAAHRLEEPLGQLLHPSLHVHAHDGDAAAHVVGHVHSLQEVLRHAVQRLLRPFGEPVDRAAVDQARKVQQAPPEGVADWRHREYDVQSPTLDAGLARLALQGFHELRQLVLGVQVGHLSGVEDAIYVLHEALEDDLRVVEEEHGRLVVATSPTQDFLQVVAPLGHSVRLADLNAEQLEVRDGHGQRGERLSPAAADAHQQSIAVRQVDDARDARHVLDGVLEQHQIHRLAGHHVVVLQVLLHHLLERFPVLELHVLLHRCPRVREVAVQDAFVVASHLVPVEAEGLLHLSPETPQEPVAVVAVRQSIMEHSNALVRPEAQEGDLVLHELGVALQDALEDLAQVAEVEDSHAGLHHALRELLHVPGEALGEEPVDDEAEDAAERRPIKWHKVDEIEVAHVALRDPRAPALGWTHRGHKLDVYELAEGVLFPVVPPRVVHPLAKDLDGRLRAVLFLGWHVQVVNEDDADLAQLGAQDAFAALGQLSVDDVLRRVGGGLSGEVEHDVGVLGVHPAQQLLLDGHALASARLAGAEDMEAVRHKPVHQPVVADGVHGGHHDALEGRIPRNGELRRRVQPAHPKALLHIKGEVVQEVRVAGQKLRDATVVVEVAVVLVVLELVAKQRPHVPVKELATGSVDAGANAPGERQDERAFQRLAHVGGEAVLCVHHARHHAGDGEDQLLARHRRRYLAELRDEVQRRVQQPVEQLGDELLVLLPLVVQGLHPDVAHRRPAEVARLAEDHSHSRHRRWRRLLQVLGLKHHRHGVAHLDDLAAHEAQLLVVVQHGVHVLDPHGIHGPVEHDPLAVVRGVASFGAVSVDDREDAVAPLMRVVVKVSVELAGLDALGVHRVDLHGGDPRRAGLVAGGHRLAERVDRAGLARAGLADDHDSVAHEYHLVELDHLLHEGVRVLQLEMAPLRHLDTVGADVSNRRHQRAVIRRGHRDAREKVRRDTLEERQILDGELGEVNVVHRAQHEHALRPAGVVAQLLAQVARRHKNRIHRAHAVVVVLLAGQLLAGQLQHAHELLGVGAGVFEAERVEADLRNKSVVGHHHRAGAEERLEVVWKLRAASVAGVHRDEDVRVVVDPHVRALEVELRLPRGLGLRDGQDLLRNHTEHLDVDPVELVKAAPGAAAREALEKLGHGQIVKPIRAVEDYRRTWQVGCVERGERESARENARARECTNRLAKPKR
eukprot:scaffold7375_cov268-Pinguiococcus_pyrenoidosus.AAC.39